jgi:hypothetical protein
MRGDRWCGGVEPEGTEGVQVSGRDATFVIWSPDHDGDDNTHVRLRVER